MYSAEEKAAGRRFRDDCQAQLAALNRVRRPTYVVSPLLGVFRHKCPARGYTSRGMDLREIVWQSPAYQVFGTGDGWLALELSDGDQIDPWPGLPGTAPARVPAGRFGFVFKDGTCRRCGQSARSLTGRLVPEERAPLHPTATRRPLPRSAAD